MEISAINGFHSEGSLNAFWDTPFDLTKLEKPLAIIKPRKMSQLMTAGRVIFLTLL